MFAVMNKYPYTPGHFMIIPHLHTDALEELPADEWAHISLLTQKGVAALKKEFGVGGVNIGMNLGHAAGAGIAEHIHLHLVPRWQKDSNFITTIGDARVYSIDFEAIYQKTFYCTIAQLSLEMLLDGSLDDLSGIITPTICDTLRPMSQNIRVAMGDKMPVIFLAHPQNRSASYGLKFCVEQYTNVKKELEKITGKEITDADILQRETLRFTMPAVKLVTSL